MKLVIDLERVTEATMERYFAIIRCAAGISEPVQLSGTQAIPAIIGLEPKRVGQGPVDIQLPASLPSAAPPSMPTIVVPPAPPAAPVEGERDVLGVVWDANLHSESKAKNADGTWRRRRNTGGKTAAPAAPQAQAQPATEMVVIPDVSKVPPPPVAPPPSAPAVAPPPPPVPTAVAQPQTNGAGLLPGAVSTFPDLVKLATKIFGDRKLNTVQLLEICEQHGVKDIHACSMKPDVIPALSASLYARAYSA